MQGQTHGFGTLSYDLAHLLGAPAVLSTFSRLLIDPNRGADDPTLVMRLSDGAIVPGNAHIGADEIECRRLLYWAPYRDAVAEGLAIAAACDHHAQHQGDLNDDENAGRERGDDGRREGHGATLRRSGRPSGDLEI